MGFNLSTPHTCLHFRGGEKNPTSATSLERYAAADGETEHSSGHFSAATGNITFAPSSSSSSSTLLLHPILHSSPTRFLPRYRQKFVCATPPPTPTPVCANAVCVCVCVVYRVSYCGSPGRIVYGRTQGPVFGEIVSGGAYGALCSQKVVPKTRGCHVEGVLSLYFFFFAMIR